MRFRIFPSRAGSRYELSGPGTCYESIVRSQNGSDFDDESFIMPERVRVFTFQGLLALGVLTRVTGTDLIIRTIMVMTFG